MLPTRPLEQAATTHTPAQCLAPFSGKAAERPHTTHPPTHPQALTHARLEAQVTEVTILSNSRSGAIDFTSMHSHVGAEKTAVTYPPQSTPAPHTQGGTGQASVSRMLHHSHTT